MSRVYSLLALFFAFALCGRKRSRLHGFLMTSLLLLSVLPGVRAKTRYVYGRVKAASSSLYKFDCWTKLCRMARVAMEPTLYVQHYSALARMTGRG